MLNEYLRKLIKYRDELALLLIYSTASLAYLYYADWAPFVFDNNETYSSIIHAKNLVYFNFTETFGLTDESYGNSQLSHPYVYTHQGNFPRFYAMLLYILGAKTAELQILITTFTVGVASFLMAYIFFKPKKDVVKFSLIYCLILLTDYLLHFQWQFNTWRVWHMFFMFSSLNIVNMFNRERKGGILTLSIMNFAALTYYEIVYASFVIFLVAIYALGNLKTKKSFICFYLSLGIGCTIGAGVLIGQLILHFGLSTFLKDISLTFGARNFSPKDYESLNKFTTEIWEFVKLNHIVFWDNFVTIPKYTSVINYFSIIEKAFYRYNLMVYTPIMNFVVAAVSLSVLCVWGKAKVEQRIPSIIHIQIPYGNVIVGLFLMSCLIFLGINGGVACFGEKLIHESGLATVLESIAPSLILILVFYVFWCLTNKRLNINAIGLFFVLLYLLLLAEFSTVHKSKYDVTMMTTLSGNLFEHFWETQVKNNMFGGNQYVIPYLSILFGIISIVESRIALYFIKLSQVKKVFGVILSGFISYSIVYYVLGGYIFSAYFNRYVPYTVYIHILPYIITFTYLLYYSIVLLKLNKPNVTYLRLKRMASAQALVCITILLSLTYYWASLNVHYLNKFNLNQFSFLDILRHPPYNNKSFVVNTYSAPVSVSTSEWSYFDPKFGNGRVNLELDGYYNERDTRYLWLTDYDSPRYRSPDYFLCAVHQNYHDIVLGRQTCSEVSPLVKLLRAGMQVDYLDYKLAANDSILGSWAIVKLDTDPPPYLERNIDPLNHPTIKMKSVSIDNKTVINVQYNIHNQNVSESPAAQVLLFRGSSCNNDSKFLPFKELNESNTIVVPNSKSAFYKVRIIPSTNGKKGAEYWSNIYHLNSNGSLVQCIPSLIQPPRNITGSLSKDGKQSKISWESKGSDYFYVIKSIDSYGKNEELYFVDQKKSSVEIKNKVNGEPNYFSIKSCTDYTCSSWSDKITSSPDVPVNLMSYITDEKIQIMWGIVSNSDYYEIAAIDLQGHDYHRLAKLDQQVSTYQIDQAKFNSILLRSCNSYVCSRYAQMNLTLPKMPKSILPLEIKISKLSNGIVEIAWENIHPGANAYIDYTKVPNLDIWNTTAILPNGVNSHMMGSLPKGMTKFRVSVCNENECIASGINSILVE